MKSKAIKAIATLILVSAFALLGVGCAGWDAVNFGLDVANADTTLSIKQNDGKTVVAAEKDGQRVGLNFRR